MMLQIDGREVHAKRLGEGPQVLLLHGWGPGSVSLEKQLMPIAARLKNRFEVTMLDFPGHGQSGMPGDWGVKDYAEWTIAVMNQLGLSRPHIIAHSFGGRVALYLAANEPERVQTLILTGCAGLRSKKTPGSRVRSLVFRLGRAGLSALKLIPAAKAKSDAWLGALRAAFSSADYLATPEGLRGSFSRVVRQDLRPLLPQIRQKTLLVWGEKDTATPLFMGQAMQREIPDARLLVYAADDHFAYLNQPARFVTAVEAFLEEVGLQ